MMFVVGKKCWIVKALKYLWKICSFVGIEILELGSLFWGLQDGVLCVDKQKIVRGQGASKPSW